MKDTQLYEQLLGLSAPWSVSRVELELERNRITVHVQCDKGVVWGDPETGCDRAHVHGWVQREWRRLDTCQVETRIVAEVPRLKYKSGRVEDVAVPWAERYSRITLMMEAFVVRLLQAASNISRVASLIKLDWHTVNGVMHALSSAVWRDAPRSRCATWAWTRRALRAATTTPAWSQTWIGRGCGTSRPGASSKTPNGCCPR